eukprot:8425502-Prorocentrum_lima.AAC.1
MNLTGFLSWMVPLLAKGWSAHLWERCSGSATLAWHAFAGGLTVLCLLTTGTGHASRSAPDDV